MEKKFTIVIGSPTDHEQLVLKFFDGLQSQKIDKIQFFEQFYSQTGILINEEFCLAQINKGLIEKDSETIDIFIQIGFMLGFTSKSLPIIFELLMSPYHHMHEDLAMLLKDINRPSNVDCLFNAAELQFDYLEYDDTFQFGRKCIKALSAIGDANAIDKLKLLSASKIAKIAEYAKKELSYKGLL